MAEELSPMDLRIWAIETTLAFVMASQHLQTSDPTAALGRLRLLVLAQAWPLSELPQASHAAAIAELERVAARIAAIQKMIPQRLVD